VWNLSGEVLGIRVPRVPNRWHRRPIADLGLTRFDGNLADQITMYQQRVFGI
jgi:hypothetical protein